MKVTLFPCGPAANESELKAFEHLKNRLQNEGGGGGSGPVSRIGAADFGDERWVLLTNLAFSVTHQLQSDEIDIVVIGPPGVRVVEVKHWTAQWVDANPDLVAQEADRVTNKARKIGTTLRKHNRDLSRVDGAILLTQDASKVKRITEREIRGVRLYSLNDWKGAIGFGSSKELSPLQVEALTRVLEPKCAVAMDGSLRRLAGYVNLERQSPRDERFHRIYKGTQPARRDRVILHLYDISASDDKNAEAKAKREFDALHRLQLYPWVPRILDSYQEAPGYAGEMYFFTVIDPAAPSIEERASDETWDFASRLAFARAAVQSLRELHQNGSVDEPIIHRNLTPKTILVKHDNSPILTGLDRAKIPSDVSVASPGPMDDQHSKVYPLEVRLEGLGVADQRTDVYGLCYSLLTLFEQCVDGECERTMEVLARGVAEDPGQRCSLEELEKSLSEIFGDSVASAPAPPARFWTEEQVVRFRDHDYRIVSRLGSGGIGTTFKVVELDRVTKEDLGTYVAKVVRERDRGQQTLRSYSLARSHLGRHPGLSAIFEVAKEWQENSFLSLMTWVEGTPLAEFTGVFSLLADDLQEATSGDLAVRWIKSVCQALDVLHRNGLVHGDVSPRNLIVSGNDLVLTDFDFVAKVGEKSHGSGTVLYCAPIIGDARIASPGDDIYALASSIFHVVYDREPFRHDGKNEKERGLNYNGLDQDRFELLDAFLKRATDPNASRRFASVDDVDTFFKQHSQAAQAPTTGSLLPVIPEAKPLPVIPATELGERRVEWLRDVLRSYPGSPGGNQETRGLDSDFATSTYVETALERTLLRDMKARHARLVVLCGNAGDGKTALLQHIAQQLGLGKHSSADRILQGKLADGLVVRMNLDGSAAWKGRSADELLDEFLKPFQQGEPTDDVVHLLAINDGRLLEWIDGFESRHNDEPTPLTEALLGMLQTGSSQSSGHIRFISLNQRTLVGDVSADSQTITTEFLDRLVDHLYGGTGTETIWTPCASCSAQSRCEVFRAGRLFAPEGFPARESVEVRKRARERLSEALQAVHLRGEIHITVRELRAALVYILFGVHFCDEYHSGEDVKAPAYWDRAFCAESPSRQGEVLRELIRFDPGLEAHPQIDRHLTSEPIADSPPTAPRYPMLVLESGRRRAFFEWTRDEALQIGGSPDAIDLARGRHLRKFRDLPLFDDARRNVICGELCKGISRLEDLPPKAFDRDNAVPLRVTPRTPTETAFWVEKPLASFRLEATLPPQTEGIERLHRQAVLRYRYRDGREEALRLGGELFHLLLELADGYQLGDVSTDDTFANLSIFVQRLVQEDASELLVWNPMADETIYEVKTEQCEISGAQRQCLSIASVASGGRR